MYHKTLDRLKEKQAAYSTKDRVTELRAAVMHVRQNLSILTGQKVTDKRESHLPLIPTELVKCHEENARKKKL